MEPANWTAVLTGVIAFFTGSAAIAAWWAAASTSKTVQAQLYTALMAEYGSDEMRQALQTLKGTAEQWRQGQGIALQATHWAQTVMAQRPADNAINNARRRVGHFYRRASLLISKKYIKGSLATDLNNLSGVDLVPLILLPLERAWAAELGVQADEDYLTRVNKIFGKQ